MKHSERTFSKRPSKEIRELDVCELDAVIGGDWGGDGPSSLDATGWGDQDYSNFCGNDPDCYPNGYPFGSPSLADQLGDGSIPE